MRWGRKSAITSVLRIFWVLSVLLFSSFCATTNPEDPKLRVHFIDVGYGDAIWVELPDSHNILIDAGGWESGGKLLEYLSRHNVKTLDAALITHPHRNHFEGFFLLLENLQIGRIYTNGQSEGEEGYAELLKDIQTRGIPLEILKEGSRIKEFVPEISMRVLNPADLEGGANDNSLVVWLRYQKTSFLFTGDIGVDQQNRIFTRYPRVLQSSCIQLPHHGLDISEPLRKTPAETVFVASTGPNPWHPAGPQDLEGLPGFFRTDVHGTIVLESDGKAVRVVAEKSIECSH